MHVHHGQTQLGRRHDRRCTTATEGFKYDEREPDNCNSHRQSDSYRDGDSGDVMMKTWFKGLLSSAIGGAANAITVMAIDPLQFNFSEGLVKLATVAGVSAIVSVAMYLKSSPLP